MKVSDYLYVSSCVNMLQQELRTVVAFRRVKNSVQVAGLAIGSRDGFISFCFAENSVLEYELHNRVRRILELNDRAFYDLRKEQNKDFLEYAYSVSDESHKGRYLFEAGVTYRACCLLFDVPCLHLERLVDDGILAMGEAYRLAKKWSDDLKNYVDGFRKNV